MTAVFDLLIQVTFDAQGGENPTPTSKTVIYSRAYGTLPTLSRTGYSFKGWWTQPDGKGTQIFEDTLVAQPYNHTLYAYWQK